MFGDGDSYSIYCSTSDWQCIVEDYVAAISGKAHPLSSMTVQRQLLPRARRLLPAVPPYEASVEALDILVRRAALKKLAHILMTDTRSANHSHN